MKRLACHRCVHGISRVWFLLAVPALAVSAWVAPVFGEDAPDSKDRLLNDVKYLASDELEGRGVGSKGLNLAADFVRQQFERAGLDVTRVKGGAFQKFTMVTSTKLGSPNTLQLIGPGDKTIDLKMDTDFHTCSFGGSGTFQGGLVFVGYAIDAKDQKYDDFKGVDVKGKVVAIMRRTPQQGNPHSPFSAPHGGLSRHAELRTKVSNAFQAGAAAIVFINDPYSSRKNGEQELKKANERVVAAAIEFDAVDAKDLKKLNQARQKLSRAVKRLKVIRASAKSGFADAISDPLMKFGYGPNSNARTIPVFHITQKAFNQVLGESLRTSLAKIEAQIDKDLKPHSATLTGWSAKGTASVERVKADVKNVVGVLEGTGPTAGETIVIGAHYDHVGRGGPGSLARGSTEIHNGADDNASGTVSLIELARRLAGGCKEKLPRRLVFIAFTAEERGLIGSARYVREPIFPLEKTIAMFNMDMVGRLRDDKLTIFGTGTAPRWKGMLEQIGTQRAFKITMKPSGFGPSDQSSFYAKKIPVLHFFTGSHSDYHRPGDDWQKVNVEGMTRIVDMLEQVIVATAKTKERPKYLEVKQRTAARSGNRPYFGSIPDFGTDKPGYAISGTAPGSPAAKGGLKGGDIIVQLGKNKIGGLEDFDLALRKFSSGDNVDVTVMRGNKPVKLKVKLDKPR